MSNPIIDSLRLSFKFNKEQSHKNKSGDVSGTAQTNQAGRDNYIANGYAKIFVGNTPNWRKQNIAAQGIKNECGGFFRNLSAVQQMQARKFPAEQVQENLRKYQSFCKRKIDAHLQELDNEDQKEIHRILSPMYDCRDCVGLTSEFQNNLLNDLEFVLQKYD